MQFLFGLAVCVVGPFYLFGVVAMMYLTARRLPGRLRERPETLGGPVLRALSVASLVLLWPFWLFAVGCVQWGERRRCPWGGCGGWNWRVSPAPTSTQALITVDQCPHRQASRAGQAVDLAAACGQIVTKAPWRDWYVGLCAAFAVTMLGALASLPIPGPGFVAVYLAVITTAVFPLTMLAEEFINRIAWRHAAQAAACANWRCWPAANRTAGRLGDKP